MRVFKVDVVLRTIQLTVGFFALFANALALVVLRKRRIKTEFGNFHKHLVFISVAELLCCMGFVGYNFVEVIVNYLMTTSVSGFESPKVETVLRFSTEFYKKGEANSTYGTTDKFLCMSVYENFRMDVNVPYVKYLTDGDVDLLKNSLFYRFCGEYIRKRLSKEDNKQKSYLHGMTLNMLETVKPFYPGRTKPGKCTDFQMIKLGNNVFAVTELLNNVFFEEDLKVYFSYVLPTFFRFAWFMLRILAPVMYSLLNARNWAVALVTLARAEVSTFTRPYKSVVKKVFTIRRMIAFTISVSLCLLLYHLMAFFYCPDACLTSKAHLFILVVTARSLPILLVLSATVVITVHLLCFSYRKESYRSRRLAARTVVILAILFTLFEATSDIIFILDKLFLRRRECVITISIDYLIFFTNCSVMMNSCANIFAFGFSNKKFRDAAVKTTKAFFKCKYLTCASCKRQDSQ